MPSPNLRIATIYADVVELVDTHALGACASRREGSSPFIRTKTKNRLSWPVFCFGEVSISRRRCRRYRDQVCFGSLGLSA